MSAAKYLVLFALLAHSQALGHARISDTGSGDANPNPGCDLVVRDPDPGLKNESFVCGADPAVNPGAGNRSSNPNRIRTFLPGETITVCITETINHISYYRVDIDMDYDPALEDLILLQLSMNDASTPVPNYYSFNVTLPNAECSNCTIRMTQIMDPLGVADEYRSCADIVISSSGAPDPQPTPNACD